MTDEELTATYLAGVEASIRAIFDDPRGSEADSAWKITKPYVEGPSVNGLRAVAGVAWGEGLGAESVPTGLTVSEGLTWRTPDNPYNQK
jgi:hypothetical protein